MRLSAVVFCLVVAASPTLCLARPDACPADRALTAYRSGDFVAAADLFDEAIRCGRDDAGSYYNAACAEALAGRRDAAFAALESAVVQGYDDLGQLASDSDLASLRDDPRWPRLLRSLEEAQRRTAARWGGAAFATPFREDLPEDEKLAGLSQVWAEARAVFANFDLVPGLDWDAAYLEWMPRVRATRSTADYYRELQALVAKLGDGHTGVAPPKELWGRIASRPALETERIEGRVIVTEVMDPEVAQLGVAVGQELVAVDGEPVEIYATRAVRPYQSASTPQDLDVRVYRQALLRGAEGTLVRLRLREADGTERDVEVVRRSRERLRELAPAPPPLEVTPLAEGVLRIGLHTFDTEEVVRLWRERWPQIAAASALILDLRDNGGGNSGNAYAILASLVDRPFATSAWRTRVQRASYRVWGAGDTWLRSEAGERPADGERHFAGPVAVLIGPRTYSAAEDFAVAFDAARRGELVGEPTGGSTGQPLTVRLPGGGSVRICTKRDTYPDGREFVGVGVQPTLAVSRRIADLRTGGDAALDAAFERLKARLEGASAP